MIEGEVVPEPDPPIDPKRPMPVGKKMNELRAETRMTHRELAGRLGTSLPALHRFFAGGTHPNIQFPIAILDELGVTDSDLRETLLSEYRLERRAAIASAEAKKKETRSRHQQPTE